MNESNKLPQAISHKKLSFLLLNAQKDRFGGSENSEQSNKLFKEKKIKDIIIFACMFKF